MKSIHLIMLNNSPQAAVETSLDKAKEVKDTLAQEYKEQYPAAEPRLLSWHIMTVPYIELYKLTND